MKKNGWILVLFVILGLLAGSLAARALKDVHEISFLTRPMAVSWSPAADLGVIRYDLKLSIDLTLLSILGAAGAIWLYRKM
ncbi:DUF4321 domain-containing protein [Cohnella pontilimi]|uniref:DUF4321 domain-containing protein n=1 Tax=Cohnella pontilimi TaxID=2564100 RepID=A0A4U0FAA0_9BACL|nr:DUF4321 domain-containing protein [Cohnella pontilimi]TJY41448.1 DUF4321 domain-containing protein [Cohnella pontilimi]